MEPAVGAVEGTSKAREDRPGEVESPVVAQEAGDSEAEGRSTPPTKAAEVAAQREEELLLLLLHRPLLLVVVVGIVH